MDNVPQAKCPSCNTEVVWVVISLATFTGDLMRTGVCYCPRTLHVWDERDARLISKATTSYTGETVRNTYEVSK